MTQPPVSQITRIPWGTKTAKRDIADLKKKRLIIFAGAPKTGEYLLERKQ